MTQRNRGKKSNDDKIFSAKWWPVLSEAVDDFCFLLGRGYTEHVVVEFVGNRYKLNKRQRNAILRISASAEQVQRRKASEVGVSAIQGAEVEIDGFNLLILLESALSGGYIFKGRDSTYRDLSSVHGSYKRVAQTSNAIVMAGKALQKSKVSSVKWYLDKPVSNSGLLRSMLLETSRKHHFDWQVSLVNNPDKNLSKSQAIIVTSDSVILDQSRLWLNLGRILIEKHIPDANVIVV
jgi:hypothetical protein